MGFFKNFFVAFVLTGIVTRVAGYFFQKQIKKTSSAYLSFAVAVFFFLPIMAFFAGFDVVFSEYIIVLLMWLIFDLLRAQVKDKKKE